MEKPSKETPGTADPRQLRAEDWSFGLPIPSQAIQRRVLWLGSCFLLAWSIPLHLYDLGGSVNLDTINWWIPYTDDFWKAVKERDWAKTYVVPHPGVVPMWVSGAWMKLQGVFARFANAENIVAFKQPLVLINAVVPTALFLVVAKRLGETGLWVALALGVLWVSEPFVVSLGRLYYMDVPFASWSALSVWLCAVTLATGRYRWCVLAGVALGIASTMRVLPAMTVFAGVGVWFGVHLLASRGRDRQLIGYLTVFGAVALLTLAFLWPSFLFEPLHTLEKLYASTSNIAKRGHRTYFMGTVPRDPGAAFYAATLLTKTSPEMLTIAVLGAYRVLSRRALRPLSLGLMSAYLPYLVAILWSNKKVGRYLLDVYPVMIFFASIGGAWIAGMLYRTLRRRHISKGSALAVIIALPMLLATGRTLRLTTYIPHLAAWCADYPGLPCDRLIAFRPFIGLRDTARWIESVHPPGEGKPRVFVTYWWRTLNPMPWLDIDYAENAAYAEYVVVIDSVLQRGYRDGLVEAIERDNEPDYRFTLGGREFVRVYRR